MRFSTVAIALASAAVASAADIQVTVGASGNSFNPTNVMANVGDTIHFQFYPKNHTVTQSTFANPCAMMTTPTMGIDSGFQPVAAGATQMPSYSFTINNASAPLWFYCRQAGHCQQGMVFAVNPTANKTFAAFQAAAMASGGNSAMGSSTAAGAYPSGTTPATTAASGSASAAATTTAKSGALRLTGSSASVLAIAGLAVGLVL